MARKQKNKKNKLHNTKLNFVVPQTYGKGHKQQWSKMLLDLEHGPRSGRSDQS